MSRERIRACFKHALELVQPVNPTYSRESQYPALCLQRGIDSKSIYPMITRTSYCSFPWT